MRHKLFYLMSFLLVVVFFAGCTSPFVKTGPLEFIELTLSKNSIGVPRIGVTVVNVSAKPVKAFTVKAVAKDAYGNYLKAFGFGDYTYSGVYQSTIEPGQTRSVYWTMNGYDTAYEIEVTLDSTIDTDNRKWTVGGIYVGDPRYVKVETF